MDNEQLSPAVNQKGDHDVTVINNQKLHSSYHGSHEFKLTVIRDSKYGKYWSVICKLIDHDAAAFILGPSEFYFGHALSARSQTLEDAYAFLCEFTSCEGMR